MLPLPAYMPTWDMGLLGPFSLKKTRSPRLRLDFDLTLWPKNRRVEVSPNEAAEDSRPTLRTG